MQINHQLSARLRLFEQCHTSPQHLQTNKCQVYLEYEYFVQAKVPSPPICSVGEGLNVLW